MILTEYLSDALKAASGRHFHEGHKKDFREGPGRIEYAFGGHQVMISESVYKRYIPEVDAPEGAYSSSAVWFIFAGNKLLVKLAGEKAVLPKFEKPLDSGLEIVHSQYLGTLEGERCFSGVAADETTVPEGMEYRDLRSLYGILEDDEFLLAGRAVQIAAWDSTNLYCSRCGLPVETVPGERAKKCPKCGLMKYPQICPAIIVAITKDSKILLAHNRNFKSGLYSIIAGFLEPGETFEECVHREVAEEVGIRVRNIKYFKSQPWPFPNSLMVGFTAEYDGGELHPDGVEIKDAGWYGADELPMLPLPSSYSVARQLIDWFSAQYA